MIQWNNNTRTGGIYNRIPNTKQTKGVYYLKFTNVSMQTQM